MFGWCKKQFGSLPLFYEVNDRFPDNILSLKDIREIGVNYAESMAIYFKYNSGNDIIKRVREWPRECD
jgi:hypothetical protein